MTETKTATVPTVSEMVRKNYRTADVLHKWGINYCCGGNLPLADACALKGVELKQVQHDIDAVSHSICLPSGLAYETWPIDFLIDYIVLVHHAYLKQVLPLLHQHLHQFAIAHAKKHPHLRAVADVFQDIHTELAEHNHKEEERIFPYLKQVAGTYRHRESCRPLFMRTPGKPLDEQIAGDQKRIATLLEKLRAATNNYQFESTACTNHQVIYHKLKELDNDLVQHKHLEHNILYPQVLEIERELLAEKG